MVRRQSQQDLDDLPDPTIGQVLQDCQARIMALTLLFVEKKIFTEQEFQRALVECDREIEEKKTKELDTRREFEEKAAAERVRELYGILQQACEGYIDPQIDTYPQIDIFRDEQVKEKSIWFRVVSPTFARQDIKDRHAFFYEFVYGPWMDNNKEHIACALLLSPEEQFGSEANKRFNERIREQRLVPVKEKGDPCPAQPLK